MSDLDVDELPRQQHDSDGSDEVGWKLPVAAAVLGALVTATFVIFVVVTGPTNDTTAPTTPAAEASDVPDGYSESNNDVAFRAELLETGSDHTTVFVSSVAIRGTDPVSVTPEEAAAWSLRSDGVEVLAISQYAANAAPGAVTVEFDQAVDPDGVTLTMTLPGSTETATDRVSISSVLPVVLNDHRIVAEGYTIVIDELVIGDGWGLMRWHLEDGVAAKVDVVVRFGGTNEPSVLVSAYSVPTSSVAEPTPPAPLWLRADSVRLVQVGAELSDSNSPTDISIDFSVSVVVEPGRSIDVPVRTVLEP